MATAVAQGPRTGGCPVRALFIEDDSADVELSLRELRKARIEVEGDVVQTPEELSERLRARSYDLVLADYRLPGWTGLDALDLLRAEASELPVILVTGGTGEEAAVECLKRGAADYVLKNHLERLPVAVRRALESGKLERRRKRAEEELEQFFQLSLDLLCIAGYDGRAKRMNPAWARTLGQPLKELEGRRLLRLVHPEDRRAAAAEFAKIARGASTTWFEARFRARDGSYRWLAWNATPAPRRGLIYAVARDVTERRQAQSVLERQNRRVREANQAKNEFLANMSHELRSPLNCIIGFTELMHDGRLGPVPAEHQEYLGDILSSAKHLLQLVNDVLDLAKVESGRIEFRPEPVALVKLVREAADVLRAIAVGKRIAIQTEVPRELSAAVLDPARFKQVLYNYLSNALKFTPEDGVVRVRIRPEGAGEFRLEVEDNGIGIAASEIPKLFAEFRQLDSGAAKKYPGSGLGLALTKRIVEAQGGRVGVHSQPRQGSVFFAVFPRVAHCAPQLKECSAVADR